MAAYSGAILAPSCYISLTKLSAITLFVSLFVTDTLAHTYYILPQTIRARHSRYPHIVEPSG
jgi:hypothetical protein